MSKNNRSVVAGLMVSVCVFGWLGIVPRSTHAQDLRRPSSDSRLVDLSGDRMTSEEIDGQPVRRLIGNVRLREEDTVLQANRATQYTHSNQILFEGNVVVYERGDTLRSRSLLYNRVTKVGVARGDVRLSDGEVLVRAPSATYYTSEKRTIFTEGVTLVDSVSVLTSRTGTYWSDEKRAEFAGEVVLDGTETDVRADSLTYHRDTEVSVARGNVFVESVDLDDVSGADTSSVTIVVGDWAFTDDPSGIRRMRDNVLLFQVRRDSTEVDSLLIRSDALQSTSTDSVDLLAAVGDVQIWNTDTAAIGDSVSYRTDNEEVRRETIELFRSPVGWFGSSQVTGDSLIIRSTDGSIDTLRVRNNTIVADRDTTLDRIHQVSGRHLLGLFDDSGRRDMIVGPNAEAIYYLEKEGRPDGAVKTSADRIVFELQDDELKRIRVEDGVEGTYYPEDLLPSDLQLAGFRWMPERRPERDELLSDARLRLGMSRPVDQELEERREGPVQAPAPPQEQPQDEPQPTAAARELDEQPNERPDQQTDEPSRGDPQQAVQTPRESPADDAEEPGLGEVALRPPPQPADEAQAQPAPAVPGGWVPGGVDVSRGGYTIVVVSRASIKDALDVARYTAATIESPEDAVDVLKGVVDGRLMYRIVVGQYRTSALASRAMRRLADRIPADSWPLAITPDMLP